MIPSKYAVVVVQIITIIVTSMLAALQDDILSTVEAWQIAGIGVGSISAYLVPLLKNVWAAALKFSAAVAGAALAAVPPIVDTANGGSGWTGTAVLIVILAGLNAALTAWGVTVRLDAAKEAIADPRQANATIIASDPQAVRVVAPEAMDADAHLAAAFRP